MFHDDNAPYNVSIVVIAKFRKLQFKFCLTQRIHWIWFVSKIKDVLRLKNTSNSEGIAATNTNFEQLAKSAYREKSKDPEILIEVY